MNIIRILNKAGDKDFVYNPKIETQVLEAEKKFNELKSNGYTMFKVDPKTKETELIEEFFKDCPQVVAVPQIVGG